MTLDDAYTLWLKAEIGEVPPLGRDEEIRCVQHIRARDQQAAPAGERLVEANLHLVVSIAERYRNDRMHNVDLIMEGNKALLGALQAFSESHEDNFSAHATSHIERAIAKAAAPGSTCGLAYYPIKTIE
jgi:DNA-directed RNA polymerase sigma subunit (sigma70/sigma32)